MMYPHERSLVKKMEGKPFTLLGVNSDKTKAEVKTKNKTQKITWRSFWNGGSVSGPISRKYGVEGWPTLLVIDANGIIRYKWKGSPRDPDVIDKSIEALIEEMGRAAKTE